jgi:hypothetical protein
MVSTAPPRSRDREQVGPRDREQVAERLLLASAKHSYDPVTAIDWDAPLLPGVPAAPLNRVSLYGTDLWKTLTPEQQATLSCHEFASVASVGLWFEIILMQALLRYAYDQNPYRPHTQYALTEIGDETRHSIMFARAADKLTGGVRYRPTRLVHQLGRVFKTVAAGPSMFASVLVAEETLDRMQREIMADDSLQPLSRMVSRIHVTEEARHVRYAREAVLRQVPRLSKKELGWHRTMTAVTSWFVIDNLIDPAVYSSVGLDPQQAAAVARDNPHHRENRIWMAEKVTAFLGDAGIIVGPSRAIWRQASLIP